MQAKGQLSSYLLVLLALCGLAACGNGGAGSDPVAAGEAAGGDGAVAKIEGSVIYRERMLLPPGFEVEVQLQDISKADAMATVMATVLLQPASGPPYPFAIEYDPSTIDPRMRYALRATIAVDGRMMFSSTDYIDPFAGNPVEILVRRVPEPVSHATPAQALAGPVWFLQTLGGEPAGPGVQGKPLDIQFLAADMRAAGFSGCNRYSGAYSLEGVTEHGSALQLGPIAGTLMACVEGGELERNYLQMLGSVSAFRIEGDTLSLLSGPEVLATFRTE